MRKHLWKLLALALVVLVTTSAFATVTTKESGTRKGTVEYLNFDNGLDVTISGMTAEVDVDESELDVTSSTVWTFENVATSSDTVVAADDRTTFVYTHSATTTTVTLPACAEGLEFRFVAAAVTSATTDWTKYIYIDPASTADTIRYLKLDAGDKVKSTGATGDSVTIMGSGSNVWYIVNMNGSWTDGGA